MQFRKLISSTIKGQCLKTSNKAMEDLAWGEWELRIEMSGILSWGWIFKALDENYIKKTQGPSYWPHYDWRNASCRQGTCPHSTLPAASDSSSWWDLRLSPEIICYKILSQVWPSMSAPLLAASLSPGLWLVSELPILASCWSLSWTLTSRNPNQSYLAQNSKFLSQNAGKPIRL